MGKKFQYVSIDRIISKIYRDLGIEEISETDVVEWVGEALEGINAITAYEEAVAFIEIKNHQGSLPKGLHSIIQVARDNHWAKESEDNCSPINIQSDCSSSEIISNPSKCGCSKSTKYEIQTNKLGDKYFYNGSEFVFLDCNGGIIGNYDVAYYRPYFDLKYEYELWRSSNIYKKRYTPIKLADHTFFSTLVCPEDNSGGLYSTCTDEYSIFNDTIRTSFKEGFIAIAYYKQAMDNETGYPLIPDDYSYLTAITKYITMMYTGRMYYLGKEGFERMYLKAEADWHWYCKQAGNKALLPHGIDEHENFKNMKNRLIPQNNRYYGFFGKLNNPQ